MAAPRNDVDFDKIIELYVAGESLKKLSTDFGVARTAIIPRLRRAEVPIRGRSDAAYRRMARLSPDERLELAKGAHEAARGRVKTHEEQVKRARSRESNSPRMSTYEAQFAAWLDERNVPYRREVAIDKYNVDFAFAPVAVEILGGEWHGTSKKTIAHRERTPKILDAGWSLLFIWATPTVPLTVAAMDYAISLFELSRFDPSVIGEYRVIGGEAQLLAEGRSEDCNWSRIPAPRRRNNARR